MQILRTKSRNALLVNSHDAPSDCRDNGHPHRDEGVGWIRFMFHRFFSSNKLDALGSLCAVNQKMNPPRIIGIVGASGSGKTSIAKELAELAGNASLMSQDNYYRGLPDGIDAKDWNFDDPAGIDLEHLARDLAVLKRGETVEGPRYIFSTHKRAPDTVILKPAPLIVVEGLFLFLPESLRAVFDLKIFVDLPLASCLERRVARDVVERGRTAEMIRQRWVEQVEPMYRKYVEPTRAFADILLVPAERGTPERAEQIKKILES